MRERPFLGAMRLEGFLSFFCVIALIAPSAGAALKKYGLARQQLLHFASTSPQANFNTQDNPGSVALVDESGASPVLLKYVEVVDTSSTTQVPALTNGFIYAHQITSQGPENNQTGTGSTATSINWGNLHGWTLSGFIYCHSVPSLICDLASGQDSETTDPEFLSSNYDIGTWTFHGTGWTMNLGYIQRTSTLTTAGNLQYIVRGVRVFDGSVPTVPLLAVAAVSISVFAMGMAAIRSRK